MRLSERLLTVASFVEQGAVVADIGSDHAYLPSFLVKKGIVQQAVAGEVAQGPFNAAMKNVVQEGLEGAITVRLADGLLAMNEDDDVDTVTIAGMGGSLIVSILENGKQQLQAVKRLIVQPNLNAKAIREWAVLNEWQLVNECILKEDGKLYEVLVLEKGQTTYSELELLVGPFLLVERNAVFQEKWTSEMAEWHRVLRLLENAEEKPSVIMKKAQLTRYVELVGKELGL